MALNLDAGTASHMARIALGHVTREFPHKLDHVLLNESDALGPKALHPIFFGSFDWHSCVHGWWTLLTLRRLFPDIAEAADIEAMADDSFTNAKVEAERAYLDRPVSGPFERPYGWAWLLYLHLEARRHEDKGWGDAIEPLATAFADRFRSYLNILTYPIRAGTHFNTAFALILAREWAEQFDPPLGGLIGETAWRWFEDDRDCQAWEPSGDDFLSPALTEALAIATTREVMFPGWFAAFLPRIEERSPATLFVPATVSDRSDGKIAHLDGLNLSRAWCWRRLAPLLPPAEERIARETAELHLSAAMPHLSGDYMGEHWLASFALLALLAD
ncbi:MAG TPA: DUF2891 domain-containing protein [Sphingomicrobium sp.]|nr:DUF2891 domain-containing protein [Sphingomicrobium sp.]